MGELVWDELPNDRLRGWQMGFLAYLQTHFLEKLLDVRQGFTRISLVWKEPIDQISFQKQLQSLIVKPAELPERIHQIPVCYGMDRENDFQNLANSKQIAPKELIELHSSPVYRIHFFGFLPGFMYLQGLKEELYTPRKAVPAPQVKPGSVAIGGKHTGIYPSSSPGGWHVIGLTPLCLFNAEKSPPVFAEPGERIRFVPISPAEFENFPKDQSEWRQS